MSSIGIDCSMRSTGLCYYSENKVLFSLVANKNEDDEQLIIKNTNEIIDWIKQFEFERINLEGLSFGSLSGSKDIIAGNFWYLRCLLIHNFPNINLNIVPVLSWRSPLFNKEERNKMKVYTNKVKELKASMKSLSRKEKLHQAEINKDIILGASIKHQTLLKCPDTIQSEILSITFNDSKYDLSDSYFLALYSKGNSKK